MSVVPSTGLMLTLNGQSAVGTECTGYECLSKNGGIKMDALELITKGMLKEDKPEINVGDTVKVHCRIKEGEKERIQIFEGIVIAKKHGFISSAPPQRAEPYSMPFRYFFAFLPFM